jgi:DNA-binding CsgD family transcriptional regulator
MFNKTQGTSSRQDKLMAKLKPNQEQAAYLIATGSSCKEAAEAAGVTPETISQWKRNDVFTAKCNEYRREVMDSMRDGVRSLSSTALSNLQNLIENAESENVKLRACLEVLKMQGMSDPQYWGWGIGHADPDDINEERRRQSLFTGFSGQ